MSPVESHVLNWSYQQVNKSNACLKGHYSLDIETITFASTSFNDGHVQIYFKTYLTGIGNFVLKL